MEQINIRHTYTKYVSLNIFGMIGLSCYILADTFFVARGIGANGLAALNLAIPVYSFIHGTGLMIGMGGATRFAISKSKSAFTQSCYFAVFAACFFTLIGIFFHRPLAHLLGADASTLSNTAVYLKTILCFSPLFLMNNVLLCFIRNDKNPKLSMIAMVAGSCSNIVLDYVFIFHFHWGMFGAAFATGIAPLISCLILSGHFMKKKHSFHLFRQVIRPGKLVDIGALGISALITECSYGIVMIVFNQVLLSLEGNTGVAAYGIIANILLVLVSIFTGISQGMQPAVSLCYGRGLQEDLKKVLKYGLLTAIFISLAVYGLCFFFAEDIVSLFNKDQDPVLASIAVKGIRISFLSLVFTGINMISAAYFSAVDHPRNGFLISFLRGFILILPITLGLSFFFGIHGVWMATACTELLVLMVTGKMLYSANLISPPPAFFT